jgi:hypothetical protein
MKIKREHSGRFNFAIYEWPKEKLEKSCSITSSSSTVLRQNIVSAVFDLKYHDEIKIELKNELNPLNSFEDEKAMKQKEQKKILQNKKNKQNI